MPQRDIGSDTDPPAFGDAGSVIAQLKRNRLTKSVQADFSPSRGVSRLRDEKNITNNSGNVAIEETGGEIRLKTGADGGDVAILETAEPFQYRSGTYANPSIGIRPEKQPDGQIMRWGYFNDTSGIGWGYDKDGIFTFRRQSGSDTIHRPSSSSTSSEKTWNQDNLEGSGLSGVALDVEAGNVYEMIARFYGEGVIRWTAEAKDPANERAPQVVVDRRVYKDEVNQIDFNRPLRVEVDNNGTASGIKLFVGGRQFSLWEDEGTFESRDVTPVARGFTINNVDTWENVMAIRKKNEWPPGSGRNNTVRAVLSQLELIASQDVEVRAAFDATTDLQDADYNNVEGWPSDESSIEVAFDDDTSNSTTTAFSVTTSGLPVMHQVGTGGAFSPGTAEEDSSIPIGQSQEVVIQARSPSTGAGAVDVLAATVQEQW